MKTSKWVLGIALACAMVPAQAMAAKLDPAALAAVHKLGVSPPLLEEPKTSPHHPYYKDPEQPGVIITAQPE